MATSNPVKPGLEEYVDLMVNAGVMLPWIPRMVLEGMCEAVV